MASTHLFPLSRFVPSGSACSFSVCFSFQAGCDCWMYSGRASLAHPLEVFNKSLTSRTSSGTGCFSLQAPGRLSVLKLPMVMNTELLSSKRSSKFQPQTSSCLSSFPTSAPNENCSQLSAAADTQCSEVASARFLLGFACTFAHSVSLTQVLCFVLKPRSEC